MDVAGGRRHRGWGMVPRARWSAPGPGSLGTVRLRSLHCTLRRSRLALVHVALDDAEDAALLTGAENAVRIWRFVAAVALVPILIRNHPWCDALMSAVIKPEAISLPV
jgi:hypothetical protein